MCHGKTFTVEPVLRSAKEKQSERLWQFVSEICCKLDGCLFQAQSPL